MPVTILDTDLPSALLDRLVDFRRAPDLTPQPLGNNSREVVRNAPFDPYVCAFSQEPFAGANGSAIAIAVRDFLFQIRCGAVSEFGFKVEVPFDNSVTDGKVLADPQGEADVVLIVKQYGDSGIGTVYSHPIYYPTGLVMKVSGVEDTGAVHLGGGRVRMSITADVPNTTWSASYRFPFQMFGDPSPIAWRAGYYIFPTGYIMEVL